MSARRQAPLRKTPSGFVLVCVIWVVAILTVMALGFGHRAMLARRASAYSLDHTQAMLMARGAVQRGIVEVRNKIVNDRAKKREPGSTHLGQEWAKEKNLLESGPYFEFREGFEEDFVAYIIEDGESRIDVNTAPKKVLEEIKPLSRSAIRGIWKRRKEGVHENEGSARFHALEELRYMNGVREDDWYGTERMTGLSDIMCVHGDGRINVNTASHAVLMCVPRLGRPACDAIINYRAGGDGEIGTGDDKGFKNFKALVESLGIEGDPVDAIGKYCKFTSGYFKITGMATRRQGKVRAVCCAVIRSYGAHNAILLSWREEALGA